LAYRRLVIYLIPTDLGDTVRVMWILYTGYIVIIYHDRVLYRFRLGKLLDLTVKTDLSAQIFKGHTMESV